MNKLNQLLIRLAQEPSDHPLTSLEQDVRRALRGQPRNSFSIPIFGPLQVAALGIALIVGVIIGGISGASHISAPSSLFAAEERLAVSTILVGG